MRAILVALLLLGSAVGARAQETALAIRLGDLWGLTGRELEQRLGERMERLPQRWDFGPFYADHRLNGIGIGGESFSAYLQMDRRSGRLQQLLLERRQGQVTPESTERVIRGLIDSLGKPDLEEVDGDPRLPTSARIRWRRGDTTIQAHLFDFYTTGIFSEDPIGERGASAPFHERMRNNPRFLPRRLTIRFHPSDHGDPDGPSRG